MNFVLGLFIFIIVGLASGVPTNSNVISAVTESYPAASVLQAGDKIVEINVNWLYFNVFIC